MGETSSADRLSFQSLYAGAIGAIHEIYEAADYLAGSTYSVTKAAYEFLSEIRKMDESGSLQIALTPESVSTGFALFVADERRFLNGRFFHSSPSVVARRYRNLAVRSTESDWPNDVSYARVFAQAISRGELDGIPLHNAQVLIHYMEDRDPRISNTAKSVWKALYHASLRPEHSRLLPEAELRDIFDLIIPPKKGWVKLDRAIEDLNDDLGDYDPLQFAFPVHLISALQKFDPNWRPALSETGIRSRYNVQDAEKELLLLAYNGERELFVSFLGFFTGMSMTWIHMYDELENMPRIYDLLDAVVMRSVAGSISDSDRHMVIRGLMEMKNFADGAFAEVEEVDPLPEYFLHDDARRKLSAMANDILAALKKNEKGGAVEPHGTPPAPAGPAAPPSPVTPQTSSGPSASAVDGEEITALDDGGDQIYAEWNDEAEEAGDFGDQETDAYDFAVSGFAAGAAELYGLPAGI